MCLASRMGGGLTILRDLHRYASESGCSNQWLFILSDQEMGLSTSTVRLVQAAPRYRGWRSRLWAELTVARHAVNDFDPDIVLSLQNVDTPARGRRPLAIYMHQSLPFTDTRFSPWRPAERSVAIRQIILGALIRASINRAHTTFVQTRWIADAVSRQCPKARVLQIGYSAPVVSTATRIARSETTGFVYPASPIFYKDHATLHKGVRLWRQQSSDTGRVVITLTKEVFENLVGGLSDVENQWYEFVGHVSPSDLTNIYARSILVFPSYVETLGLPLYEAQRAQSRIVAADTPPSREALEGYPAAHYFRPRSPSDLARALDDAWKRRDDVVDAHPQRRSPGTKAQAPWDAMLAGLAHSWT